MNPSQSDPLIFPLVLLVSEKFCHGIFQQLPHGTAQSLAHFFFYDTPIRTNFSICQLICFAMKSLQNHWQSHHSQLVLCLYFVIISGTHMPRLTSLQCYKPPLVLQHNLAHTWRHAGFNDMYLMWTLVAMPVLLMLILRILSKETLSFS